MSVREIVAVGIKYQDGEVITSDTMEIKDAVANKIRLRLIDKKLAASMAALDLGPNWERLSRRSPIFCIE